MTQNLLKKEIKKVILAFEPRVNNVESVVTVSRSGLQYDIEIFLQIFNLIEVVSFTATLDRIR
jgi:predicted component of type VI protein secretion system